MDLEMGLEKSSQKSGQQGPECGKVRPKRSIVATRAPKMLPKWRPEWCQVCTCRPSRYMCIRERIACPAPLVELFFRSFFGVRPQTPKMTKKQKSSGLVVAILHLSAQNGNPQKVGKVVVGPPGCPAGGEKWVPDSSQPPLEKHGRTSKMTTLLMFWSSWVAAGWQKSPESRSPTAPERDLETRLLPQWC